MAIAAPHSPAAEEKSPLADMKPVSVNLPLNKIVPSKTNRHAVVDDDFLESIRQHGVNQPILVRPVIADAIHLTHPGIRLAIALGETIYEIVCGERRWSAATKAGHATIPAVVRKLSDAEAQELQVVENDQRRDLDPLERARAYAQLRDTYLQVHKEDPKYTEKQAVEEVCARVNRESRTVQQVIALEKLDASVKEALRDGEIQVSHAYEFCRRYHQEQRELLKWMRSNIEHSNGDVPSVRRLKREIQFMDDSAEMKRKQMSLPGTEQTSVQTKPATLKKDDHGKAKQQNHSAADTERERQKRKEEQERNEKRVLRETQVRIRFESDLLTALAAKASISKAFIDHIVPQLILHIWQSIASFDRFAQAVLGWPSPKNGTVYHYQEVKNLIAKPKRKYTPSLLAALVVMEQGNTEALEKISKSFGVDTKKMRIKAAEQLDAEALKSAQTSAKGKVAR